MCNVPEVEYISCQLSFYSLGDHQYKQTVYQVVEIIEQFDVEFTINSMATIVTGTPDDIFSMLRKIYNNMNKHGYEFVMNVLLSNTCGQ